METALDIRWGCAGPAKGGPHRVPEPFSINGAGEGIRTLDPDLGKVVLYP